MITKRRPASFLRIEPNDETRKRILSGELRATVRAADCGYVRGPAVIGCTVQTFCVDIEITRVERCKVARLTDDHAQAAGFDNRADLLADLHRLYDGYDYDLSSGGVVTIVYWDNVSGELVNRYWAQQELAEINRKKARFGIEI